MPAVLVLRDISKSFGTLTALKNISFEVAAGEVVALLGPSGCGKSTLLTLVAGLEMADNGDILWEGHSLRGVAPHRRGFGLMFQDFALFPHLDVAANVAFGLRMAHWIPAEITARVQQMLEMVGLPGFEHRDVNTLSGGEQQRVALARSLAPHPRLLMLDEPLGSLDRNLRQRLTGELRHILHTMGQTALYVTHDLEEAFALADRVVVMSAENGAGQVEQIGTAQEIYTLPATTFVARFLGFTNLLPGQLRAGEIQTALGSFPLPANLAFSPRPSGQATLLIRPDAVQLGERGPVTLRGTVQETVFRGNTLRLSVGINATTLFFDLPARVSLPTVGQAICLSVVEEGLQILPSP